MPTGSPMPSPTMSDPVAPPGISEDSESAVPPAAVPASDKPTDDINVNVNPRYPGTGTLDDPFVVTWGTHDPADPYSWPKWRRRCITAQQAAGTWIVSFGSSAYSAGIFAVQHDLHASKEVCLLGISLYVLGFGLGPLIFAPLSEMYGRRIVFLSSTAAFILLQIGGIAGRTIAAVLASRLLAGIAGAATITNSSGVIADIWPPAARGVATSLYSTATFLGPVVGPIVGGFVAEDPRLGWRFIFWLVLIFAVPNLALGALVTPETYAPVLLRRRAARLQKAAGGAVRYISVYDVHADPSLLHKLRANLRRPFVFLLTEPIVLALSLYIALAYSLLYALLAAFPLVFEGARGLPPGRGGLAFLGVGAGIGAGGAAVPVHAAAYRRAAARSAGGRARPEERLRGLMFGGVLLPIGLFWFAWTSAPPTPLLAPILAGLPLGLGVLEILRGVTAYLMDAYGLHVASAAAATVVARSGAAAALPLLVPALYGALGPARAGSALGGVAAGCVPLPFLLWRYGSYIRSRSKYAVHDADPDAPETAAATAVVVDGGDEKRVSDVERGPA